jgi:hypothetical protein
MDISVIHRPEGVKFITHFIQLEVTLILLFDYKKLVHMIHGDLEVKSSHRLPAGM